MDVMEALMAWDRHVLDDLTDQCSVCDDGRRYFARPAVADEFGAVVPMWQAMVLVFGTPGGRTRERRLLHPDAVHGPADSEGCLDVRVDSAACILRVWDEDAA